MERLGRYEEAAESYELAEKYNHPLKAWLQYQKGMSLHGAGRLEDALIACEKSISLGNGNKYVYFERHDILKELGRFEQDHWKPIPGDPYAEYSLYQTMPFAE